MVLATEAAVFTGADAIKSGLADQLVNYADAIAVMADALKPKMERFMRYRNHGGDHDNRTNRGHVHGRAGCVKHGADSHGRRIG